MLLFELDLTSAQSEKIKALQQESRTATRTYQDQIRKAEESIGAAVQADTLDEDAVRTQAAAIGSATTEMKVIQARTHAAIWKLLTADQQSQLKQRLAEWKPQGRRGR
jgi:Spy/CpxP family protein refolding chaperone